MAVQEVYVLVAMVVVLFVISSVNGFLYLRAAAKSRHTERMLYVAMEEAKMMIMKGGPLTHGALRLHYGLIQIRLAKRFLSAWWVQYVRSRVFYLWRGMAKGRWDKTGGFNQSQPRSTMDYHGSMEPITHSPAVTDYYNRGPRNPLSYLDTTDDTPTKATPRYRLPVDTYTYNWNEPTLVAHALESAQPQPRFRFQQ
eukprot:PhF_6_TR452/c0_g1_i1/m.179